MVACAVFKKIKKVWIAYLKKAKPHWQKDLILKPLVDNGPKFLPVWLKMTWFNTKYIDQTTEFLHASFSSVF